MISPSTVTSRIGDLLREALTRAGVTGRERAVTGLTPAAKAAYAALVSEAGVSVVVVPSDRDLDEMTADVRFSLEALGHASDDGLGGVYPLPSREVDPYRALPPHLEVASARARALHALSAGTARVIVASAPALIFRVTPPEAFGRATRRLTVASEIAPVELADVLAEAGYAREDPVDQHGEFCVRGGIVDFFPPGSEQAIRLEFLGDTVESIRRFDPATQRSTGSIDEVEVVPLGDDPGRWAEDAERSPDSASFLDYLAGRDGAVRWLISEPEAVDAHGVAAWERLGASHADALARGAAAPPPDRFAVAWDEWRAALADGVRLEELALADAPGEGTLHVACQPVAPVHGRIADWVGEIRRSQGRGDRVLVLANSSGVAERTLELLAEYDIPASAADSDAGSADPGRQVIVGVGTLTRGYRLPAGRLLVYAEADVFEEQRRVHERRPSASRTFLSDFRDLKVGDHVVHVDHGIGRFMGLRQIPVGGEPQEFMELRYHGEDKLFVPVEHLDLVQKYSGGASPALDRLGGASWEKAKTRVRKAMREMAGELLKLYAARKALGGHAYAADSHWQAAFDGSFEYDLTPDQAAAIDDIARDMESPAPMDRLLCGDVGYGKTEVAMRAAFKAVIEGKQVAVLTPTTILALQHLKTFSDRFAAFPVRIDMVSRLRSRAEQKETLSALAAGKVDIIIGTHRLLSKDVTFHDLGLLVVDEEQRFGVAHKERIKQWRRRVDALAMTATPIPRTLNMSLVGIRDMSIIETPPRDRLAIQTSVVKFDRGIVATAIRQELERGGQVFFVHNRVESIASMADLLRRLVPEARLAVGHGQMGEVELERVMVEFVEGRHDVLLATTIVENGLDIPNANTIIINRADRYGLAQLYQLRGRVGRSDRHAYAYLLIPAHDLLSPVARRRLAAIREFSDLGSGFRVAALDLEIRGAGNLLGGEQSGHIEAVGFEMYMKLLEEAVRELKGEDLEDEVRAAVNLSVDVRIGEDYIFDTNQRLTVYRRVAGLRDEAEVDRVLAEVRDRFGPPPEALLNLAAYARIRILADRLRIESIERERDVVVIRFRESTPVDPARVIGLVGSRADLELVPPATLRLDLRRPPAAPPPATPSVRSRRRGQGPAGTASSWWTRRAHEDEVRPGFSKAEMLRPAPEAPRADGGLFDRLTDVLVDLSGEGREATLESGAKAPTRPRRSDRDRPAGDPAS